MTNLRTLALTASLLIAAAFPVKADGIFNPGSGGGGGALNGFVTCSAGVCTFTGADGSTQMVVGTTNSAIDYLQVLGGVAGGGATMNCTSASDTNVGCNFTGKGNGAATFNNGHGNLGAFVDPGSAVSTNGGVQLTPSISNGPVKVGNATYGVNLDCGTNAGCDVAGLPLSSQFPGYIVGNWYEPFGIAVYTTGVAVTANTIRLTPAFIMQKTTINALGARVSTLSAGGNFQLAIYANNAATGRPTGTALASTASMSTAAAASLNASVSVQLSPGLYWFALNCDNATAAFTQQGSANASVAAILGSATQNIAMQVGAGIGGVTASQTFGTWPDLTSASFTEAINTSVPFPIVQFKIASVP